MEFPVIEFLGTQFVVGAEGTGGGPALDYLITFSSHCFPCRHAQHLAGGLIQVQKLIGADIADIGIAIATVAAINIPATFLIFFIIIFPFF